jgi:hypothetical protein
VLVTAHYTEAIRLDPSNATIYNGRCWVRALAGCDLEARADYDERGGAGQWSSYGPITEKRGDGIEKLAGSSARMPKSAASSAK